MNTIAYLDPDLIPYPFIQRWGKQHGKTDDETAAAIVALLDVSLLRESPRKGFYQITPILQKILSHQQKREKINYFERSRLTLSGMAANVITEFQSQLHQNYSGLFGQVKYLINQEDLFLL